MINNFMQINTSGGFFIAIPNKTTQIQNAGECVSFNMKQNKKQSITTILLLYILQVLIYVLELLFPKYSKTRVVASLPSASK